MVLVAVGLEIAPVPKAVSEAAWAMMTRIAGVPVVLLIWALLLQPQGISLYHVLAAAPRTRLAVLVVCALGIDLLFSMLVTVGGEAAGLEAPWHLLVDEPLLFGSAPIATLSGLDVIVLGPAVEELLFRGVLYTGLRHRMHVLPAALLCGVVFGAIHGYDALGFAVVAFSGFLYAIVYERTNSIVACMLVHACSNAFAMTEMLIYRTAI